MARLNERVTAAVCVVAMRNDEEFIALHRTANGTWSLPGGKPDGGESPVQAAHRELFEETGAVIDDKGLQPLGIWTYDRWDDEDTHFVTLFFIGDVANPLDVWNTEPAKHGELRWVTWDTLPQPVFPGLDHVAALLG